MMSRLFQQPSLSKAERRQFIPFVNERNFMGALLGEEKVDEERASELINTKNMALIENLRKSTKEYFFDKKYQKMAQRLHHMQRSLHHKDPDYDQQVARCFETLNFAKTFSRSPNRDDQKYYVDLKENLNERVTNIKTALSAKLHSHRPRPPSAKPKGETRSIRREVFGAVGKQSEFMADFSNCGLKYRHLVQSKKIDPWKKWYVKEDVQIFPGETVALKKLQKTIY